MHTTGDTSLTKRDEQQDALRQEIQGKPPSGSYEFADDLTFASIKPTSEKPKTQAEVVARNHQRAIYRDARYGSARGPYLLLFGLSQALHHSYSGSKKLADGGVR